MATEYEVNIKLNTRNLTKDLDTVGKKISNLGKTQNTKAKNALNNTDAVLKKEIAILATENRALRTKGQLLKLEKEGVNIKGQLDKLDTAIAVARRGEVDMAKVMIQKREKGIILSKNQLINETKITEQKSKQVALSTGIASPVFGKPSQIGSPTNIAEILNNPISPNSPVQQALKKMDDKTKSDQKQAELNRKKSLSLGKDLVKIKVDEAKATANILSSEAKLTEKQAQRLNAAISPKGDFSRLSDRQSRNREGRRTFMNNPLARRGLPMPTRGFDFQSAIISGGFPLLFGQGPITAAAGALGGGVGGMFGQMGGFAGGIAATAIVGGIQQQIAAVAELGQAFNSVTPNIQALTSALGIAGTEEEKRLQLIQKQQGSQAALSAVTQQMNELIGENGVKNLKEFGDNTRLLSNEFAKAMTKFKAALAPLLNMLAKPFTGQLSKKEQERLAGVGGAATDETLLDLEEELGGIKSTKQNRAKRNRIKARIADRKEELSLFGQSIERANNLRLIENDITRKNRQKNELLQATIDGNKEQVQLSQDIAAEVQKRLDAGSGIMEIDVKDIENQVKKTKELEKQAAIAEMIEQSFKDMVGAIATDLSDGIKGLIRGTSTLNDVLSNVLDKMMDAAFNMAFFGNAGGTLTKGLGLFGNLFEGFLSTGGPAKAGKSYIVGEKGPELFTPGVSGMVSPNSSLGGSTNIVVNVDASGSNVEGDQQSANEFGEQIAAAVQAVIINEKRVGGLLG